MRVALFFDGKNFYSGWKDAGGGQRVDFVKLSRWLVERVGGSFLWGAYYYTGIESDAPPGTNKLAAFLDALERRPGFFVNRFPRKTRTYNCASCGAETQYTEEKEVDTTMVADMLRLAAVGAFDIVVLVSGDADLSPAVEGVRALGRQVYVATWTELGLSARLRKAAFDHIDLQAGIARFQPDAPASLPDSSLPEVTAGMPLSVEASSAVDLEAMSDEEAEEVFLDELSKAEEKFGNAYVGANYFVTRWRSEYLDPSTVARRRLMRRLEEEGKIEIYDAEGGDKAIRRR